MLQLSVMMQCWRNLVPVISGEWNDCMPVSDSPVWNHTSLLCYVSNIIFYFMLKCTIHRFCILCVWCWNQNVLLSLLNKDDGDESVILWWWWWWCMDDLIKEKLIYLECVRYFTQSHIRFRLLGFQAAKLFGYRILCFLDSLQKQASRKEPCFCAYKATSTSAVSYNRT